MIHPQFDPVALALGPLKIQWYGLMYLAGFAAGLYLGIWRARKQSWRGFTPEQVQDLLFYIVVGIIVGGRVGYVLFYNLSEFFQNPLYLFRIWEGGMSFHGGFLGVCLAVILFARKTGKPIFAVGDFVAPLVPPGIFFGRLGNFINGELWGRPTDVSWGMIFPQIDGLVRHPSQLYQMAGEGLGLFILMWWFSRNPRPRMAVSGLFIVGYGVFRTTAEFFREPDEHLGIRALGFLTQGMILSIPMILIGILMMVWAYRRNVFDTASAVEPSVTGSTSASTAKAGKTSSKKQSGKSGKGKRT